MKTLKITLALILAATTVLPSVRAAQSRPNLTGRVLDADGAPVAKAIVFVYSAAPKEGTSSLCPYCYVDCAKQAKTDAEGRFKIESLDPTLIFRLLVVAGGRETKFVSKVDPVKGEQTIKMKPLSEEALHSALRIKGMVVNEQGKPVPEAIVNSEGIGQGQMTQWGGTDRYVEPLAVTDDEGHFILLCKSNTVDTVYVTVSGRGAAKKWFTLKPSSDYLLRLLDGVTVTGQIVHDGKPLKGVSVGAASSERRCGIYLDCDGTATDSDGRFHLFNVPPTQEFVVYATMKSLAGNGAVPDKTFTTGESGATHDLGRLEVGPAFKVAGRIMLSDGKPVPANTRMYLGRETTQDSVETTLAADGSFEFTGVPAESVGLAVRIQGYRCSKRNPGLDWLNGGIMGRVTGDITDMTILLEPGEWEFNSNEQPPDGGDQQPREKPLQGVKLKS
jgi:hypothetical protein